MATCSQSPLELLQGVFCPTIAVTCSEDAERVCMKNQLSFVEMTRPFCQLTTEAHIRDPSGVVHTVKNWKLRLLEVSAPHPPHHVISKLLHEVVARTQPMNTEPGAFLPQHQAKASTPWFEAYRDCFFQLLKSSDHEFIRHFLACVFVVSSHHSDPMNAFAAMTSQHLDQQQPSCNSQAKWFTSGIFRYYVLLHDVCDGVESKADAVYQSMKSVYGLHACHMLMVNSVNPTAALQVPNLPDPWSQFIIPASEESLDWDDSVDDNPEAAEDDPINCAVDENFDPDAIINDNGELKTRSGSGSMLIGPLTFEDVHEPEYHLPYSGQSMKGKADLSSTHEKKHLPGQYRYFSTRKFTSAVRSQVTQRTHGLCLSLSDQDRIKIFIHELAFRGLLPYVEKMMKQLSDQIMARKGLHRSIFSATKKWFGGGKPAGLASGLVPGIIYPNDAPELYHRKLGDLAFLVQNYELAYTCYHTAKRDFNNDHAWFYFAGTLEMAAISAFLARLQRPYPSHYMETAISTYLNACRQHMFAVRATLLSTEILKAKNITVDAAMQFIRMTGEESDLLCALLLEQSAHCFLHSSPVMVRKYAFNMILAGHRFSKAAQRKHALRCYQQALYVYEDRSWHLAEDHINFTLGRQSFNLKQLDDALKYFRQLLMYESQQLPQQQAAYLKEFLCVFKQLLDNKDRIKKKDLPYLPLPVIDAHATRTILSYRNHFIDMPISNEFTLNSAGNQDLFGLFGETKSLPCQVTAIGLASFDGNFDSNLAQQWKDLEEEMYECVNITPIPPFFRTHVQCLGSSTENSLKPYCVINETVAIEVVFYNPLQIPLNLTDLMLIWEFTQEDQEFAIVNEFVTHDNVVNTEVIANFVVKGSSKEAVHLTVTPCCIGELHIKGVKYSLSSIAIGGPVEDVVDCKEAHPSVSAVSMLGKLDLNILGPRLNHTKAEKASVIHGQDHRLTLLVVPPMPLLEVKFYNFPKRLLCGEVHCTTAEFTNSGQCTLINLYMASTHPEFFTMGSHCIRKNAKNVYQSTSDKYTSLSEPVMADIRRVLPVPIQSLAPGESVQLPVWVKGSHVTGNHTRDIEFYYESDKKNTKMSHRALQHAFQVKSSGSLVVWATATKSKHITNFENHEKEELVVALDIENLIQGEEASKLGELGVVQVTCASRRWQLYPLSHHKKDGLVCVKPGETIMMQFKATKYQDKPKESLGFSHVAFTDEVIDCSVSPAVDFYFCSHAWQELRNASDTFKSTSHLDVGLIVFWKTSFIDDHLTKRTVMGQTHATVRILTECASASLHQTIEPPFIVRNPTSAVDRELLLHYSLNHPSTIRNDFTQNRLVSIPVELLLYNCCDRDADVFVERASRDLTGSDISQVTTYLEIDSGCRKSTSSFILVGQTSRRLRIKPNNLLSIELKALVSLPGVYNLNQISLYATLERSVSTEHEFDINAMTPQKPSPPSFIEVEDSSYACKLSTVENLRRH